MLSALYLPPDANGFLLHFSSSNTPRCWLCSAPKANQSWSSSRRFRNTVTTTSISWKPFRRSWFSSTKVSTHLIPPLRSHVLLPLFEGWSRGRPGVLVNLCKCQGGSRIVESERVQCHACLVWGSTLVWPLATSLITGQEGGILKKNVIA